MAAKSAIANSSRTIWGRRAVFVKATPAPLTFAERRSVLHALKQHCKIDYFRKLNTPGTFLSMTTCEKDTEALIARSPLGYSLYDGRTDERHPARTTVEPAGSSDNSIDTSDPDNSKNAIEGTSPKQFVVHIFRKRGTKSISELIDFDPLHGPWPTKKPDATSFIAKTLRKSIPDPILRVGLSDWETSGQLLDDQDGLDVDTGGARNPKKGREYYVQRRMDRREARERAAEAVDILNDSDLIAQKDSRPETARNTHQHTSHHHHHRHRIEP